MRKLLIQLVNYHRGQSAVPAHARQKGFAMLFTVLMVSLTLSIALGISNLTFKQTILSSLAKDSQVAFYQADAGIECGMYEDVTLKEFPKGTTLATIAATYNKFTCGNTDMALDQTASYDDYFVYRQSNGATTPPCFYLVFDKATSASNKVQARGYNTCNQNPRQVERALELSY